MNTWPVFSLKVRRTSNVSDRRHGFCEAYIDAHFRTLDSGRRAFYPFGAFGRKGFLIQAADQEARLRYRVREYRTGLALASILVGCAFGWAFRAMAEWQVLLYIAAWEPFIWIAGRVVFHRFTRRMERVDVANSPVEFWRSLGESIHAFRLIATAAMLMCGAGLVFFLYVTVSPRWTFLAIGVLVMLSVIPYGIALRQAVHRRHAWPS